MMLFSLLITCLLLSSYGFTFPPTVNFGEITINPNGDSIYSSNTIITTSSIKFKGILYFAADDGINGNELWRSDGTAAGTYMLKDIVPGPYGSFPFQMQANDNYVYFVTIFNGYKPFRTDGTTEGTVMIGNSTDNLDYIKYFGVTNGGWVYFSLTFSGSSRLYSINPATNVTTEIPAYSVDFSYTPIIVGPVGDRSALIVEYYNSTYWLSLTNGTDRKLIFQSPVINNFNLETYKGVFYPYLLAPIGNGSMAVISETAPYVRLLPSPNTRNMTATGFLSFNGSLWWIQDTTNLGRILYRSQPPFLNIEQMTLGVQSNIITNLFRTESNLYGYFIYSSQNPNIMRYDPTSKTFNVTASLPIGYSNIFDDVEYRDYFGDTLIWNYKTVMTYYDFSIFNATTNLTSSLNSGYPYYVPPYNLNGVYYFLGSNNGSDARLSLRVVSICGDGAVTNPEVCDTEVPLPNGLNCSECLSVPGVTFTTNPLTTKLITTSPIITTGSTSASGSVTSSTSSASTTSVTTEDFTSTSSSDPLSTTTEDVNHANLSSSSPQILFFIFVLIVIQLMI